MRRLVLPSLIIVSLIVSGIGVGIATPAKGDDAAPAWTIRTIDGSGDVGQYCSLKVSDNGTYFISYFDASNAKLKLATNASGAAPLTTFDFMADSGRYTSLDLDNHGRVHIAYDSMQGRYMFYLTNVTGSWVNTAVAMEEGTVGETAIAVDGNSKAFIVYYSNIRGDLWYACNSKGTWEKHIMTQNSDIGRYCSAVIDQDSRLYVSYYDVTNADLKYKYETGREENPPTVDGTGTVGQYSSIGIDGRGDPQPFISYYDASNGDLKLAYKRWDTRTWSDLVIDSVGDVGKYSSIRVEANAKTHMAYYDATNGDLKYAVWEQGVSQTYVVDSLGDVGQYASISLDSRGRPSIAYYDASNGDLKLATMASAGETTPSYGPSAPSGLTGTLLDNNSVLFNWTAPLLNGSQPLLEGYRLYLKTGTALPSVLELGNITQYAARDLTYATRYECWVTSINSVGEGDASAVLNLTTGGPPAVSQFVAPAPMAPTAANTGYSTARINWIPPVLNNSCPELTGYHLYRGTGPGTLAQVASLGNVTTYLDTGLQEGTTYYYAVSAVNAVGDGPSSAAAAVTTNQGQVTNRGPAPNDMTAVVLGGIVLIAVAAGAVLVLRKRR